jgi:single-strand DNA-binding protein
MLRVSLMGNLGADPELRYSQKGAPIASFRVAINQVRTGPDGERQENTEWFRVRAMGRLADFAQRLQKGMRVLVVGRLDIGHYQSRDGDPRVSFDVWADEVQNVSAKAPGADADPLEADAPGAEAALAGVSSLSSAERRSANGSADAQPSSGAEELEDLPF